MLELRLWAQGAPHESMLAVHERHKYGDRHNANQRESTHPSHSTAEQALIIDLSTDSSGCPSCSRTFAAFACSDPVIAKDSAIAWGQRARQYPSTQAPSPLLLAMHFLAAVSANYTLTRTECVRCAVYCADLEVLGGKSVRSTSRSSFLHMC